MPRTDALNSLDALKAHGVRTVRQARASVRPATWWNFHAEPREFRGVQLFVRPPRLDDASEWSQARLANRDHLEDAFPAWGEDWAAEQSELAWTERCWALLRAARRGTAYPAVIAAPHRPDGKRILGEMGIDSIDLRTGTGELSCWTAAQLRSSRAVRWASAHVFYRAFTGPAPLQRILAPVATTNHTPESSLRAMGFDSELILTRHRQYAGQRTDHHIYVLHNTEATRALLLQRCNSGQLAQFR